MDLFRVAKDRADLVAQLGKVRAIALGTSYVFVADSDEIVRVATGLAAIFEKILVNDPDDPLTETRPALLASAAPASAVTRVEPLATNLAEAGPDLPETPDPDRRPEPGPALTPGLQAR